MDLVHPESDTPTNQGEGRLKALIQAQARPGSFLIRFRSDNQVQMPPTVTRMCIVCLTNNGAPAFRPPFEPRSPESLRNINHAAVVVSSLRALSGQEPLEEICVVG